MAATLQAVPKALTREQKIDRYGELDRQVQAFQPTAAEHQLLKDEIKSWYQDHPADQAAIAEGGLYTVQVSPRENESQVDKPKLLKLVGRIEFLKLCQVTLKAVKESLGEGKLAELVTKERTGSRKLKCVPKAPPGEVAKAA